MAVERTEKERERFNPQLKLTKHKEFSNFLNGEKIYPINVEISPCHTCNATCDWCFYAGTHEKLKNSTLDKKVGIQLLEDLILIGTKAVTWTGGGEPTLHPDFNEFIPFKTNFRHSSCGGSRLFS